MLRFAPRVVARLAGLTLLVVILAILPGVALGQGATAVGASPAPETPDARARRLTAEGDAALARGARHEALGKYREAQAAQSSPDLSFKLATLHAELGNRARAIEAYERFVRQASSGDERRSRAGAEIVRLALQVGTVVVTGDVDQAALTVDGQPEAILSAGVARPVRADPGRRRVALTAPDGRVASEEVLVTAGQTLPLSLRLAGARPPAAAVSGVAGVPGMPGVPAVPPSPPVPPVPPAPPMPPLPPVAPAAPPIAAAPATPSAAAEEPSPATASESMPPPAAAAYPPAEPSSYGSPMPGDDSAATVRSWQWGRGLVGAGLATVVAGALSVVVSQVESSWYDDRACPRSGMDAQCERSERNTTRFRRASYVLFGAGAVAVGTGVALLISTPGTEAPGRSAMLGVRGRF